MVLGVLAGSSGCRTCDDRPGVFTRLFGRDRCDARLAATRPDCDPCASGYTAALGAPVGANTVALGAPAYPASWPGDFGPGYPVLPAGQPVPAAGLRPANELPYPTIPSPGIPEGSAQPTPAVPGAMVRGSGARVTSDAKK